MHLPIPIPRKVKSGKEFFTLFENIMFQDQGLLDDIKPSGMFQVVLGGLWEDYRTLLFTSTRSGRPDKLALSD